MKQVILLLLFLVISARLANSQMVVTNPIAESKLFQEVSNSFKQLQNQLEQIRTLKQQVQSVRQTLKYTKQAYEREIERLRSLGNRNWTNIDDLSQNLNTIERGIGGMERANRYLNYKYVQLYETWEHWEGKAEKIQKHLAEQSKQDLQTTAATYEDIEEAQDYLKEAERDLKNRDGSEMAVQQTQVKIQSLNSKQLMEIRRLVAKQLEYLSREEVIEARKNAKKIKDVEEYSKEFEEAAELIEDPRATSEVPLSWGDYNQ